MCAYVHVAMCIYAFAIELATPVCQAFYSVWFNTMKCGYQLQVTYGFSAI